MRSTCPTSRHGHRPRRPPTRVGCSSLSRRRSGDGRPCSPTRCPDTRELAVERNPADAPARLVIVIDEFAALVREVPEFVEGVVGIAQRGRTLGIHLVLATQRPAGAVSREVWANTNLRIALRVADPTDSIDVIGTADAATISSGQPGRAWVRVGQSTPIEIQSAYVGGSPPRRSATRLEARPLAFGGIAPGGRRRAAAQPKADAPDEASGVTELSTIVDITARAAQRLAIPRPPAAWLPQLPSELSLDAIISAEPHDGSCRLVSPTTRRGKPRNQRCSTLPATARCSCTAREVPGRPRSCGRSLPRSRCARPPTISRCRPSTSVPAGCRAWSRCHRSAALCLAATRNACCDC